jgi:hypothetical protein
VRGRKGSLETLGIGKVAKDHRENLLVEEAEAREAKSFLELLESLTSDSRYNQADEFLGGIYQTVEETGKVTIGQRNAVKNIMNQVE